MLVYIKKKKPSVCVCHPLRSGEVKLLLLIMGAVGLWVGCRTK